jgi:soluble lytic murein transglycosylase
MRSARESSASGAPGLLGLAALLTVLCVTISGAISADDPNVAQRAEFQQAYARITEGVAGAGDSASLQRYVLFPYLQAARLEQMLRTTEGAVPDALDQQIAAFLRGHQREPAAQDLRRSWLASLAARAQWRDFLAFHQPTNDELALRCHGFTAQIELGSTLGLAARVAQAWLTPRSLQECDRAFTWLTSVGVLTPALVEQRARLALEADNASFARQIAARLPVVQAAPLLQWAALLENPQREIDALIASPSTSAEPAALLAGWTKLVRANRAAGKQRLDRLVRARKLDRVAASPLALSLALALSWDHDADTLKYFARVEAAQFDDVAREWQTRAALWARDWKQVSRSIAAMSEASRRTARWRYWAARLAAHEGHQDNARQLYESVLPEDNYYSAMSAARLKRPIAPNPNALSVDNGLLASLEIQPAFARARELHSSGLLDQARAEWRLGTDGMPPAARAQAILLAARWGWYEQAVTFATGERVFNDYMLLYPRPYDAEVAAASRLSGLEPALIYGVIRQESLYESNAVSTANARGLMQLTLDTARRTARAWKRSVPESKDLFDPSTNVTLGAAHMKDLIERSGGQLPLALAGYNAGPGAVRRWLPEGDLEPDVWIENIPYNETRAYVQRILWHTVVFEWLRSMETQNTREWLKVVRPYAAAMP